MKILFITYGTLSFTGGSSRSIFILRALADAGYQVDVLAESVDGCEHANVQLFCVGDHCSGKKIRSIAFKRVRRERYDVVHGVGDAVLFAARLCRWRKTRFVYDAERCFFRATTALPLPFWNLFPKYFLRLEKSILTQAAFVFSPCATLTSELLTLDKDLKIHQVDDIPIQPLFPFGSADRSCFLDPVFDRAGSIVVCSLLTDQQKEVRKILLAARKVIELIPDVSFVFKGEMAQEARGIAEKLDILERCIFLSPSEPAAFLVALDRADVALFFAPAEERYLQSEVFTLLYSRAPLLAIQGRVYEELLDEENCIFVLSSAESVAEGVVRAIREPLFSVGVAAAGRQLIADQHSFSSFKHKVRMAYRELS